MRVGKTYENNNNCLACGYKVEAATQLGEGTKGSPKSDDVTCCIACGYIMAFDGDLKFRVLTPSEEVEILSDERVLAVQQAIREVRRGSVQ